MVLAPCIARILNGLEPSIKFTKEEPGPDGSVPFLDTKCVPQPNGTIRTIVYRKPTHTDLYVQWSSNHPLSAKLSVVSSLFYRASVVCRNPDDLKSEQDYITKVHSYNGYPLWAINKGKHRGNIEWIKSRIPLPVHLMTIAQKAKDT